MTSPTLNPTTARPRTYRHFYLRAFVSMMMTSLLLLLIVSGVALFVAPPGQLANTVGWTVVGLSKGQWEAMHITFGFLWIPLAVIHLAFNRRVIIGFMRDRVRKVFVWRREFVTAVAVTLFLGVAAIFDLPPVTQLMDWEESFGAFWAARAPEVTVVPSTSGPLADGAPASGGGLGRYTTIDPETGAVRAVGKEAAARLEAANEATVAAAGDEDCIESVGSGERPDGPDQR